MPRNHARRNEIEKMPNMKTATIRAMTSGERFRPTAPISWPANLSGTAGQPTDGHEHTRGIVFADP